MALLSMRADRFWKKTGKKITIQGTDVAGFEKSKVKCFNCHKMGHFARKCRAPRSQDRGRREIYKQEENNALVADEEGPIEFALMAKSSSSSENEIKKEKKGLDSKLTGIESTSRDQDTLLGSQRSDKNKEGLRYSVVPPALMLKPSPSIESNSSDLQNSNSSVSEHGESSKSIMSKPMIKFVKAADRPTDIKINKVEAARKPSKYAEMYRNTHKSPKGNSQNIIDDKGYWNSGCSRHMTGNISYLSDYEPYDGGYVSFGQGGGKITGKECIVLGRDFKLKDDTNVLLRTPRQHNMYSINLNNIVPQKDLTCLVAKASVDKSMLWHRRLGHLNFKTMNKLVRHNLVKGLPSKGFENNHTCVAYLKGKQHKASCKTKLVNSVSKPLHTLHMDLFGPTYEETSGILRNIITEIENLKELKVKIIRCDNSGEFKNREMNEFCTRKARTMLADAKLPVTFWAEAVNTACYVQNRVLVNKSQNKTSYELFNSRTPAIGFLKPFVCHVMILNTLDHLRKFDAKGNEVVVSGTSSTNFSGTKDATSQDVKKDVSSLRYIALLNWFHKAHLESSTSNSQDACNADAPKSSGNSNPTATLTNPPADQMETLTMESVIPTVSSPVLTACLDDSSELSSTTRLILKRVTSQDETPSMDNISTLSNRFEDILGVTTNTDTPVKTKHKSKEMEEQSFIATIHQKTTPDLLQFCLFSCFLSQEEPKKISNALKDLSWVEAMQEELLQFKIQNVWILVDCPKGVRPIGIKWVLKNKKDERVIVIRIKARLVAQGHTQEEGIDYEEVFAPVARIEAIRLFLAYASFMGFIVYQMNVKSAFLYGTIDEEVYVMQPLGFQDLEFPDRVYKVEKAMYGLHQAPKAWHQVKPKECHLHAVKMIFRYLKGHPKLGLWYPKDSPFNLVAYSDSDYGGVTQDKKSTTGGCQFLGRRLIS
nr:hypothetical protein [Tanacetum cinerariifolium]